MATSPLFVREDIENTPRRHLFTLFGVPWTATPQAWAGILSQFVFGMAAGIVVSWLVTGTPQLVTGVVCGILTVLTTWMHSIGHVLSGLFVGSPMDENLVTSSRHVNIYRNDPPNLPSRVHIGRALGGPLMNILLGVIGLLLFASTANIIWLYFGGTNLFIGLGAFAPVPSVDGEVIWRELRRK